MLRRMFSVMAGGLVFLLLVAGPSAALDEESDALGFLPSDAPMVMAFDMDEFMEYATDVGADWRDADVSHFGDALESISLMLATEAGIPDPLTFLSRLSGVQAGYMDPMHETGLIVFSTDNSRDLNVIAHYAIASMVEIEYQKSLDEIYSALGSYFHRTIVDEETGEEMNPNTYPGSLHDLIEEGYLDEMPLNPYTGQPIRVLEPGDEGSLGDVFYKPCHSGDGCCGGCTSDEFHSDDEPEHEDFYSYMLHSFHIGGIGTKEVWETNYEPYDDLAYELSNFAIHYDPFDMGFIILADEGWDFISQDDAEFAFAFGGCHLVIGDNVETLMLAVEHYESGSGFRFSTPDDFDTDGAICRGQIDMRNGSSMFMGPGHKDMPPDVAELMDNMFSIIGMEAVSMQHTACWLKDGDIQSIRRVELTGEAENSLVGSLVHAQPEILMTAEGGPMEIIGEVAWANPDEWAHAYIDWLFEFVIPMIADEFGAGDMDMNQMLGMVGLGEIQSMDFGEQLYMLITGSVDRGDGMYVPGMTVLLETDNEDLPYVMVGLMDSISFMVPDFPFYQANYGDENAVTWVLDCDEFPISPTIAWTDGWVIKGLWREDVLTARDALENGMLLMPDGMDPANIRVHFHRQKLMRGIADTLYEIPESEASFVAGLFELAALLSNQDERLYMELTGGENCIESHQMLSIGMFEDLIPLMAYLVRGVEGSNGCW